MRYSAQTFCRAPCYVRWQRCLSDNPSDDSAAQLLTLTLIIDIVFRGAAILLHIDAAGFDAIERCHVRPSASP